MAIVSVPDGCHDTCRFADRGKADPGLLEHAMDVERGLLDGQPRADLPLVRRMSEGLLLDRLITGLGRRGLSNAGP